MKYFKDPRSGDVFAFEADGSQDDFIYESLVRMSDAEIAEFFKPKAYTNGEFVEYSTSVVLGWNLATQEQVAEFELRRAVTSAEERIKAERLKADQAIAPLQDAVDLDEATEAEALRLKEWKRYRVALNRLPEQPGYPAVIDWPAPPA